VSSVVQYGAIGALEGSQACIAAFREELQARRDFFYAGLAAPEAAALSGAPPRGAFYAFLRIDPRWRSPQPDPPESLSWAMAQHLITRGRIGCVPGVDFGSVGEGYVRFCFARDRQELGGALASLRATLSPAA